MRKLVVCLALLAVTMAQACLWDDDTLVIEARGLPNLVEAVTGRLPLNPPTYYRARLEASNKRITFNPRDFGAWDNVAVALDKLGDPKAAIAVLERKRRAMQAAQIKSTQDPVNDPWYRYHANLGTVYAHLWLASRKGKDTTLLRKAIQELKQSIQINPDAHFGREKVQVAVLEIVLKNAAQLGEEKRAVANRKMWNEAIEQIGRKECLDALVGIMAMGQGAESVDVLNLIGVTLDRDDNHLRTLIDFRIKELETAGNKALLPGLAGPHTRAEPRQDALIKNQYGRLRLDATDYLYARFAFVERQLAAGQSPDYPGFWRDFREPTPLDLGEIESDRPLRGYEVLMFAGLGAASTSLLGGLIWLVYWRSRR